MHCSLTERRADDATRDVENWLKCYFMQDKVGESFDGTISGVTSFGIFVTLDGLNIDGLVHVTELGRDYFHFDAGRHAMIGERSGRIFQLAGRIRVTVARVDLETAKIDFTLADDPGAAVPDAGSQGTPRRRRTAGRIAPPVRARGADRTRAWTSSSRDRRWPRPRSRPSPTSRARRASMRSPGSEPAYRLTRVERRQGVAEYCAAGRIDHAFVPMELTRQRVRVVAMDMDSTLITIECIDEIADRIGIKREVAAITAAAMRGEIDFAQSLTRRVALLAGLPVSELAHVYDERLDLSPGAELMLIGFKAAGAKTLLVSGGFTFFTDRLAARLGFDATAANTLEIADGRLTGRVVPPIVDGAVKAARLAAMRELAVGRRRHRGRDRRRRERRADAEGGRHLDRLPREAGRARAGDLCDRLLRPRRRAEPVPLIDFAHEAFA